LLIAVAFAIAFLFSQNISCAHPSATTSIGEYLTSSLVNAKEQPKMK